MPLVLLVFSILGYLANLVIIQGAPYKYIVAVDSLPFDSAPPVVTKALNVITERVRLIHETAEFNEILSVGYYEKMKMEVSVEF